MFNGFELDGEYMEDHYETSLRPKMQYETVSTLKGAILDSWGELELNIMKKLIKTMPKNFFELINSSAKAINY